MVYLLLFWSLLKVTSQDKAPSVISRVLKKNNRDSAVASEFELVQLLPGERGEQPGEGKVKGVFSRGTRGRNECLTPPLNPQS